MALSDEQEAELVELRAFRTQLRAVYFGALREISVDGVRVAMDPDQARKAVVEVENRIAQLLGLPARRPTAVCLRLDGNFPDDSQTQVSS